MEQISSNAAAFQRKALHHITVKASFPFHGVTSLHAAGRRMNVSTDDSKPVWVYFIMQIHHCSRREEFNEYVIKTNEVPNGKRVESAISLSGGPIDRPELEDEVEELPIDRQQPNSRIPVAYVRVPTQRFGGMKGLSASFVQAGTKKSKMNHRPNGEDVPVDATSFEEGSSSEESKNTMAMNEQDSDKAKPARDLLFFIRVLKRLRKEMENKKWKLESRTWKETASTEITGVLVTQFPKFVGGRYRWQWIGNEARKVLWVEFTIGDGASRFCFSLLEMELKEKEVGRSTLVVHTNDFSSIRNSDIETLLKLTVYRNRFAQVDSLWKDEDHRDMAQALFSRLQTFTFSHPNEFSAPENTAESERIQLEKEYIQKWAYDLISQIKQHFRVQFKAVPDAN